MKNMLHGCLSHAIEIHKLKDLCLCATCIALSIALGERHAQLLLVYFLPPNELLFHQEYSELMYKAQGGSLKRVYLGLRGSTSGRMGDAYKENFSSGT
ncbi:hypothetical protein MUK42_27485 [Musa troglodytarum]|uniref:Uncharacterized protein n=1 Tax=Musa troglodytarum TaxID=320322 RepID=A0A9E7FBS3_9LILI|nr:hypothetical protein MUK42_27485 [Musa troglodytarum]